MNEQPTQYYEFDCYRVDLYNRRLLRDGENVLLAPKLFDTLCVLVKNSGRALSKDELMKLLWTDTIVEERNIPQNIFQLRKILGDRNGTKYIETVSKFGYRFIPPVKSAAGDKSSGSGAKYDEQPPAKKDNDGTHRVLPPGGKRLNTAPGRIRNKRNYLTFVFILPVLLFSVFFWRLIFTSRSERESRPEKRSIAILPFKGLAGEKSDEQLQLGMTDALINKLSNLRQLSVRPTTAVLKYGEKEANVAQAASELNVESILYGTIQKSDGRVRVTVQLVQADDGSSLWAEKFDTTEKDLFDIQDVISARVSEALVTHLTADEQRQLNKAVTNDPAAFEAYSKGIYFLNKRNLDPAIGYFRQAIDRDPNFALAYNGLLDAYMLMIPVNIGTPAAGDFRRLAKAAALKTIALDKSLAEPHSLLGLIIFEESGDWNAAEEEYLKAIEISPDYAQARYWHAWHLLVRERADEAIEEMRRAQELDPTSLVINIALGQIYYFREQPALAIDQLKKTLELDPANDRILFYYGLALAQSGRYDEAIKELKKLPDSSDRGGYEGAGTSKAALGYVLAAAGHEVESKHILDRLENIKQPSNLLSYEKALIYLRLGNRKKALALFENAVQTNNYVYVIRVKFDPRLNLFRKDPDFVKLLRGTGIA